MTALAVMEDDTVLCADCLDELQAETVYETAATIVHAWLADPAGQACRCCAATTESEAVS
jgi:predicted transcriptional regulator